MTKQKKKSINFFFSIAILLVAFAFFARTWMDIPEVSKELERLPGKPLSSPQKLREGSPAPNTTDNSDLHKQTEGAGNLTAPEDQVGELPEPMGTISPDLPDDLRQQLASPPPELPDDLKAQLNAPPAELPEDIKRALETPPRIVTLDEVNTPP